MRIFCVMIYFFLLYSSLRRWAPYIFADASSISGWASGVSVRYERVLFEITCQREPHQFLSHAAFVPRMPDTFSTPRVLNKTKKNKKIRPRIHGRVIEKCNTFVATRGFILVCRTRQLRLRSVLHNFPGSFFLGQPNYLHLNILWWTFSLRVPRGKSLKYALMSLRHVLRRTSSGCMTINICIEIIHVLMEKDTIYYLVFPKILNPHKS